MKRLPLGWQRANVPVLLGLAAFAAVVFGPLAVLLVDTVQALAAGQVDLLALAVPMGRRAPLFIRSIWLGASVAAAGMVLGVLVASVLTRWRTGPGAYLRWLVVVLAPVPAYVHALAWTATAFTWNGWLHRIGLSALPLEGLVGSWWVQLMASLPIAVALALVAIEGVPPPLVEAARLARSDLAVLARVTLPLAAPMILAGGGFLFLLSVLDYGVPALFQVSVYALDVFAEYSATNQAVRAFLLALPLIALAAAAIAASQRALRQATRRPERRSRAAGPRPVWPRWFVLLQAAALLLLAAQVLVPLVSLTRAVGSRRAFMTTTSAAGSEIAFSFWIAIVVAALSVPLAVAAARPLLRPDRAGRLWWLVVTVPLALPAPLVGIGLIAIWNRPVLPDIYGSAAMPVLAALARFTPLAAIVVLVALRQVDPELIDAARLFQGGTTHGWLQIRLPLLVPGLLAGAAVAFALTLGELGATLIIAPPGQATLSMRIYNYLHYGASDTVAGLCLIMALAAVAAGLLAIGALAGWSRLARRPHS